MLVFTLLIGLLVALIIWYLIGLTLWAIRAAKLTENIPGPKPLPIIGNALHFSNFRTLEELTDEFLILFKKYCKPPGKISKTWIGPKLVINLGDPQHIETVLNSEHALRKDSIYAHARAMISNGTVAGTGKRWEQLRKLINPFVTKKAIEQNLGKIHEKAMKLLEIIEDKTEDDKEFSIRYYIAKFALDVMLVANFGCDINELENERAVSLDQVFERIVEGLGKLVMRFPSCLSSKYSKMTSLGRETIKFSKIYWDLLDKVIEKRKNDMRDNKDESNKLYADAIIEEAEREKISWNERGNIATDFVTAGTHSVSIMASTIILLLAMYPEHQKAVYQEQLEILGDDPDVAPTWEQLSKMTYLTRVFKEVIRHCTAPFIVRDIDGDIDLGKYTIPKGCSVAILLYAMHRDPTIWSHPEEFYPDHFLPEESAKRPKNSYLPFSWGPRNCPGGLYSMVTIKILISALVRKYYFKTDLKFEELKLKYCVFADIKQGQIVKKMPRRKIKPTQTIV